MLRSHFLLTVIFFGVSRSVTASPILSIDPQSLHVELGQTFSINIDARNITDLYAYQLDLTFNPAVINVVSLNAGNFLGNAGSTYFVPGVINNVTGLLSANVESLVGSIPGATGTGVLETIVFDTVGQGQSQLNIQNQILLDSSLNDIVSQSLNGVVFVDQGTSIPEPTSLRIFIVTLLLFFALVRSRRVSSLK